MLSWVSNYHRIEFHHDPLKFALVVGISKSLSQYFRPSRSPVRSLNVSADSTDGAGVVVDKGEDVKESEIGHRVLFQGVLIHVFRLIEFSLQDFLLQACSSPIEAPISNLRLLLLTGLPRSIYLPYSQYLLTRPHRPHLLSCSQRLLLCPWVRGLASGAFGLTLPYTPNELAGIVGGLDRLERRQISGTKLVACPPETA